MINENVTLTAPVLRVARPSDDLAALIHFYVNGLGLEVIDQFESHDGFDGIMLSRKGWPYHFEFTHAAGHIAGKAPTEDNLIVFYLPEKQAWENAIAKMRTAGYAPVKSFNPYWDERGFTFEDPDGYRVVLQNAAWP
ncbi:UNVERIFIED_CONTAM: hypothetical protein GTU68_005538 [Idotea baltica]|nr:hypothetical protein [Idotea baltica]